MYEINEEYLRKGSEELLKYQINKLEKTMDEGIDKEKKFELKENIEKMLTYYRFFTEITDLEKSERESYAVKCLDLWNRLIAIK